MLYKIRNFSQDRVTGCSRSPASAGYYGPEAGQPKGQNVAVSEAKDGEANEAERICRLPTDGHENGNLNS